MIAVHSVKLKLKGICEEKINKNYKVYKLHKVKVELNNVKLK